MDYRVEVSRSAEEESDRVYEWIARDSATRAGLWYRGLLDAIASLKRFPERCALAAERNVGGRDLRQLLYGKRNHKYRILFEIDGDTVIVTHIRHAARQSMYEEYEP